jgi:hypothetical protein
MNNLIKSIDVYQVIDANPNRLHFRLKPIQKWLGLFVHRALPVLIWTLLGFLILVWEKDTPWWVAFGLLVTFAVSVLIARINLVLETSFDHTGVEIRINHFWGTRKKFISNDYIASIIANVGYISKGGRVKYSLCLMDGKHVEFARFPVLHSEYDDRFQGFEDHLKQIIKRELHVTGV